MVEGPPMKYALLLSVALMFGCQDKPGPDTPSAPASAKSGAPASGAAGAPASAGPAAIKRPAPASKSALLDAQTVLRATPKQADILLATGDVAALIRAAGRDEVVKAIPELYAQAATELRKETGFDLLDPAQWTQIGLNAAAPGGMFIITRSLTVGFMITVTDPAKFQAWLSAQRPELKPFDVEGASVYADKWGPAIVLKKDALIVLGADRIALAKGWAPVIAGLAEADALVSDPRVMEGAKALGYGAHIGGFIDFQATVDAMFGLEMRQANPDVPMLMAKARGLGQPEIAEQLERFTEGRGDIGEQMAIGAIKGMIFGQMGPMSLGIEVEGAAVRLKADLKAGDQSLPRRLLKARDTLSPIGTLAGEKAALLGDVSLDIQQALAIAQTLLMTGGGGDFVRFQAELVKELGLDLKTDVIPAFTGEIGGAMLLQDLTAEGEKKLGMTLFAEVDPAKFEKVLGAITKHPMAGALIRVVGARHQIDTPWRRIEFEVKGTQLVVTTEPTAFDRAPGRSLAPHLGPTLGGLLAAKGTTATYAMDLVPLMGMFLIGRFSWDPPGPEVDNPDAKAKELLAQRDALTAQIKAADVEEEKAQLDAMTAMIGPLGHLAATIVETDTGLTIEGGLFTRGPYKTAIATFATQASTIDARMRAVREKARDLRRQRRDIDEQLRGGGPSKHSIPALPELQRELK